MDEPPAPSRSRRLALVSALGVWLAAAMAGLLAVTAHGAAAGPRAAAPSSLPSSSTLASRVGSSGRSTIVMVAHPGCPCTRASLRELDRIVRATSSAADVVILFAQVRSPERTRSGDRIADELRALAGAIPRASVVDDPGGVEASRLGARTSGTVLFYDRAGLLRFSGGITASRGHEGDSAGGDAVRALLSREGSPSTAAPAKANVAAIFGCELFDRESERRP